MTHDPRKTGVELFESFRVSIGSGGDDGAAVYDLDEEKTRLTFHQANIAELRGRLGSGEMVPIADVKAAWSNLMTVARAKMLSLSPRLASTCAGRSADEIQVEAARIIDEALQELERGGVDGLGNAASLPQAAQAGQTGDTPTK
ncbi:MAG: hypothetical protein HGB01_04670 [Chlorobiaceae bacterium]|nr:hypothetical protein [Chlorobiaceae bacterium]